ncbi:amino acid--[acyl-carrier-protein] ligase [Deltaproteobacteria bacterium]|nr:amino acid--[acyl-carrier-protein] ligase [Deltaproteobacteria bacterium]
MCGTDDASSYRAYLDELFRAGLLISSGVRGVYGRSGTFEDVIMGFERYVTREGKPLSPEVMHFPPLLSRAHYTKINHIHNFPDLMGSVHTFMGGDPEHRELVRKLADGEDWTRDLAPADVMLIPAACYPLYPTATGTTLGASGRLIDLVSYVFRHEPSDDPARMQIFRQREYVRLGTAEQALNHRNEWLERGKAILQSLGLAVEAVVANDPFFGRGGRLAKATQREQVLKFELVIPICSTEKPTAISSCNLHLDYFGHAFGIDGPDGQPAHTACIGFGLERIALALFKTHGLNVDAWPKGVRELLTLA